MKPRPERDDLARQYLLGRLPEAQREEIGELLFADESFFETVQAVEMDLRDAYARNELSGRDRDDFEKHMLRTERQRKASRVSSVLARRLPKRAKGRQRSWTQWVLVAAAAIAIPAAFYAAYLQEQIRLLRAPQSAARMTAASGQMPAVVSLFLPDLVLRGAEDLPLLRVPAGEAMVRLEVEVEGVGPFAAAMRDAEGKDVFRQSGLRVADGVVVVWLAAGALPDGVMELVVSGSGVEERRRFRVGR